MTLPARVLPILLAVFLLAAPSAFADEGKAHESHSHVFLAGVGVLLLAGGGAFAYQQNREADRDMSVYRASAFTGNTEAYREKVQGHERKTWIGLAGAALGGILLVVSF